MFQQDHNLNIRVCKTLFLTNFKCRNVSEKGGDVVKYARMSEKPISHSVILEDTDNVCCAVLRRRGKVFELFWHLINSLKSNESPRLRVKDCCCEQIL